MSFHMAESVSDRGYTINGVKYDRVTSVIDGTLGVQSSEAAACEVSKHASELFTAHIDGEILSKSGRVWDGKSFVETVQEYMPGEQLSDPKRLQGFYYRVRQGWLDRGTVLNMWFDSLANGASPTALNAREFVNQEMESGKWIGNPDPVPYQCDREDLLSRCMWLARFWRDHSPTVTHVQQLVKSEKLGCAGTLDAIGVWGRPVVWEVKAGSEQFTHQVQVSTYKHLAVGSKHWGCVILYVKADGYRLVELTDDQVRTGYRTFKSLVPAYQASRVRRDWNTACQDSESKLERRFKGAPADSGSEGLNDSN